jgi:hypothetical protein
MESAYVTRSSTFIEYMKLHLISLNQDLEADYNVQSKINIQGQIMATEHLLSVALDIMATSERYNNE